MTEEWMYQYPSTTLTKKYKGDKTIGKQFDGEVNNLLYQLKNQMKFNRLGQLKMTRTIYTIDGPVTLTAFSHFGHDIVNVDTSQIVQAVTVFYEKYLILATFDLEEMKIYFQVGREEDDEIGHNFYIDLTQVFSDLGHEESDVDIFNLSLVENYPNFGTLFYFTNGVGDEGIYQNGWVIKFKVKEPTSPQNIETYNTKNYTQHNFDYEVESYDLSDSTISTVAIPVSCTKKAYNDSFEETLEPPLVNGSPYEPNRPWTWSTLPSYTFSVPYDDTQYSYSWQKIVNYVAYDTPELGDRYLGNTNVTFNHSYLVNIDSTDFLKIYISGVTNRAIKPIGACCWIEGGENLTSLKWGIHFYCIGQFRVKRSGTETVSLSPEIWELDSPDDPPVHYIFDIGSWWDSGISYFDSSLTFQVPFLLYRTESKLVHEDKLDLWSVRWGAGNADAVGPEVETNFTSDKYSYKRTYPIRDTTGEVAPDYFYECTKRKYDTGIVTEYFLIITPSTSLQLGEFTAGANTYWTLGPDAHAGGGSFSRIMTRVNTAPYVESSDFDRSIYVIGNTLYDYDDDLPVNFDLGKASRELLFAYEYYNMAYPAIIDSDYNPTSQCHTFTAKDGIYTLTQINDFISGGLFSDGGILNKEFFYLS